MIPQSCCAHALCFQCDFVDFGQLVVRWRMVFSAVASMATVASFEHIAITGLFSVGVGEDVVKFRWPPCRCDADTHELEIGDLVGR